MFDMADIRSQFPILFENVHDQPLAYLDNAATTQKPQSVIDAIAHYYQSENANIHRGVHYLSEQATIAYEKAREKVAQFINAPHKEECIFTKGTTESINLVANSFLRPRLSEGDEILISHLEHHSNIVPWQLIAEVTGARLVVAPINEQGEIIIEDYERLISSRTKLVALNHISNALGTVNPVERLIKIAKMQDIPVLIDGAQAAPHQSINVKNLGCDFYVFSAHKMYGPTGVGVLWGKQQWLNSMLPYQGGGEMIQQVTFEKSTYAPIPNKFEAGTPNIAGVIGFGYAIDFINTIGLDSIAKHEQALLSYAQECMKALPNYQLIGTAKEKAAVMSFVHENIHAHDIGTIVDRQGVAVRTGHHCAMPVMDYFDVAATTRASFAVYNTKEDIDRLINALHYVEEVFS